MVKPKEKKKSIFTCGYIHCKPWEPLRDNLTQTFAAFYPHSDQEHLLVWGPAWKGHNRDLWSFCTDRNVLIYTLSVHGHSRRPAVWESCPVWWHRDRSGCLSPALSSKHMQLNLDWLRLTTDAARPPENWTHCPSSPFSTDCCVLVFFLLWSFCLPSLIPPMDPLPPHTQTPLCLRL